MISDPDMSQRCEGCGIRSLCGAVDTEEWHTQRRALSKLAGRGLFAMATQFDGFADAGAGSGHGGHGTAVGEVRLSASLWALCMHVKSSLDGFCMFGMVAGFV
jgi:hypothetical protein